MQTWQVVGGVDVERAGPDYGSWVGGPFADPGQVGKERRQIADSRGECW